METINSNYQATQNVIKSCHKNDNNVGENGENIQHYLPNDVNVNLDGGDPGKMIYPYWKNLDDECSVTIKASDLLSYFVNPKEDEFMFHMPGLLEAVRRIHRVVGNAVTENRSIIVGPGSSQLYVYAVRALASTVNTGLKKKCIPVVIAEPCYSALYKDAIAFEKSEMYEWKGDANNFEEKEGVYIEVVTTPNNPDGGYRKAVVKREGGLLIHDLAYYWPQYTPITAPADHDIMLFTMSKSAGLAGSRIGWAIVKDPQIASIMINHVSTVNVGSCQEGQLRAIKILGYIADTYEHFNHKPPTPTATQMSENIFEYAYRVLDDRWNRLRAVVQQGGLFTLPNFPDQQCNFFGKLRHVTPGFAWMERKDGGDGTEIMTEINIKACSGPRLGPSMPSKYVRVSMVGSDDSFNVFLDRLSRFSKPFQGKPDIDGSA